MKPGLSVEECVRRHKRYHYAFKRLHQIFTARITGEPLYELKMAFSLHAHLCAEHTAALRKRVGEMREPPLGLEAVPEPSLEIFFDEILSAPTTQELVLGLYEKAVPALKAALENHLRDTNHLADQPSVRLCRFALLELDDMLKFGAATISSLIDQNTRQKCAEWLSLLDSALEAAGTLDGTSFQQQSRIRHHASRAEQPPTHENGNPNAKVSRHYSAKPYQYERSSQTRPAFPRSLQHGRQRRGVSLRRKLSRRTPKTLMMFYKRLREIDVPEMMASIITETPDKPWEYYRDMTRQLWDEARHAMMGEVGFANLGIDWPTKVMINYTWSLALNTQLKPIERHAVLYFIEQGLMPKTGKRYEWEVGPSLAQSAFGALSGLRLGRRSPSCAHRPRLVFERFRRSTGGCSVRRRMLVAGPHGLGKLAPARPHPTSQLVARSLPRSLQTLGY